MFSSCEECETAEGERMEGSLCSLQTFAELSVTFAPLPGVDSMLSGLETSEVAVKGESTAMLPEICFKIENE